MTTDLQRQMREAEAQLEKLEAVLKSKNALADAWAWSRALCRLCEAQVAIEQEVRDQRRRERKAEREAERRAAP